MPGTPHLSLQDPTDDQHAEDQPPPAVPIEEPQIPVSITPAVIAPLPTPPASSVTLVPPAPSDSTGPKTSAPD